VSAVCLSVFPAIAAVGGGLPGAVGGGGFALEIMDHHSEGGGGRRRTTLLRRGSSRAMCFRNSQLVLLQSDHFADEALQSMHSMQWLSIVNVLPCALCTPPNDFCETDSEVIREEGKGLREGGVVTIRKPLHRVHPVHLPQPGFGFNRTGSGVP
jgi:hypothetical protein